MNTIIVKPIIDIKVDDLDIIMMEDILGVDYEDFEDKSVIYEGNTSRLNDPIKISELMEHLQYFQGKGANYVSILYHTDHRGYELDGQEIRLATQQEVDDRNLKDKNFQIDYIKRQLKKLETDKVDLEKALKRMTGE